MSHIKQFLYPILLFCCISTAFGLSFSSTEKQNTLIELYTSEGCNSCPPADSWLNSFKNKPSLFNRDIPLAFHVDYFNDDGWVDIYSQPAFSQRQRQQSKQGYLPAVYTPGILVNSVEYRIGWANKHGKPAFNKALKPNTNSHFLAQYTKGIWFSSEAASAQYQNWLDNINKPRQIVGRLAAHLTDNLLTIDFANQTNTKHLNVNVALLGMGLTSLINAGENKGKTLQHDFVVLNHQIHKQAQTSTQNQQWQIPLPNTSVLASQYALVIWLTPEHSLSMVQAIGTLLADNIIKISS